MDGLPHRIYSFADFRLDAGRRLLLREERPVALGPKAFDLLLALVENSGRVLEKDELLGLVWPGQFVEENNLTVHMSVLRKALGERKDEHRFVITMPGHGYRFVADVRDDGGTACGVAFETHTVKRVVVEEEIESDWRSDPADENATEARLA